MYILPINKKKKKNYEVQLKGGSHFQNRKEQHSTFISNILTQSLGIHKNIT